MFLQAPLDLAVRYVLFRHRTMTSDRPEKRMGTRERSSRSNARLQGVVVLATWCLKGVAERDENPPSLTLALSGSLSNDDQFHAHWAFRATSGSWPLRCRLALLAMAAWKGEAERTVCGGDERGAFVGGKHVPQSRSLPLPPPSLSIYYYYVPITVNMYIVCCTYGWHY